VWLKQANATYVKLVADAKAHKMAVEALVEAREDTRDAQQKVALAKCDAMSESIRMTLISAKAAAAT
jgi:hypothetical protein